MNIQVLGVTLMSRNALLRTAVGKRYVPMGARVLLVQTVEPCFEAEAAVAVQENASLKA